MKMPTLSRQMMKGLQDCTACHDVCLETMDYCLTRGGDFAEPSFQRLVADCAQICRTTADFVTRGSEFFAAAAALCVEVCERCENACERLGDAQLVECAEACRAASATCREIARSGDGAF